MLQSFLDLFFPRTSLTGEVGTWITESEIQKIHFAPFAEGTESLRARGVHYLDGIWSAGDYEKNPLLQRAIHTCKYKRISSLGIQLGNRISSLLPKEEAHDVTLCPVPLHWTRRFQRGFNQAALLSETFSHSTQIPVQHLLRRVRPTGHQAHRNRDERMIAVIDAFACTQMKIPSHVILVDDLATTGATLDACAHALKNSGARTVEAWVIARG